MYKVIQFEDGETGYIQCDEVTEEGAIKRWYDRNTILSDLSNRITSSLTKLGYTSNGAYKRCIEYAKQYKTEQKKNPSLSKDEFISKIYSELLNQLKDKDLEQKRIERENALKTEKGKLLIKRIDGLLNIAKMAYDKTVDNLKKDSKVSQLLKKYNLKLNDIVQSFDKNEYREYMIDDYIINDSKRDHLHVGIYIFDYFGGKKSIQNLVESNGYDWEDFIDDKVFIALNHCIYENKDSKYDVYYTNWDGADGFTVEEL